LNIIVRETEHEGGIHITEVKKLSLPLLCYDVIFKSIFVGKENLLAKMVSDITGIDYSHFKDNIMLETNELPISRKNEKAKRCDFILRFNKDNIINIELNSQSYAGLAIKNLSYLFQLFSTSFKKGDKYNENLIIMQINLNCFKLKDWDQVEPLSKYCLREENSNKIYLKNIAIYELNVVKCHELYYNKKNKEDIPNYIKWGSLIYCSDIKEIPNIVSGIMTLKERNWIMDNLSKLTRDDLFMTEEEALEWADWERNSIRHEAREEGLKEGRKIGIEKGIEKNTEKMIKNMLKQNISLEDISKITEKTKKEIEKYL